jgi:predicted XRE-type DNA-binding protein
MTIPRDEPQDVWLDAGKKKALEAIEEEPMNVEAKQARAIEKLNEIIKAQAEEIATKGARIKELDDWIKQAQLKPKSKGKK